MFKRGEDFDKYIPKEVNILEEPDYYKFIYNKKVIYQILINLSTCYVEYVHL